jgi:hypothetical protein
MSGASVWRRGILSCDKISGLTIQENLDVVIPVIATEIDQRRFPDSGAREFPDPCWKSPTALEICGMLSRFGDQLIVRHMG